MAKKKDNTLIYVAAAAAILYFLFKGKKAKGSPAMDTSYSAPVKRGGQVIVDESKHVEFLPKKKEVAQRKHLLQTEEMNLQPIIGQNEYFKEQYKESLNNCSY